jgi:hypothetical protein
MRLGLIIGILSFSMSSIAADPDQKETIHVLNSFSCQPLTSSFTAAKALTISINAYWHKDDPEDFFLRGRSAGDPAYALLNIVNYYGSRGMVSEYNEWLLRARSYCNGPIGDGCAMLKLIVKTPQFYMKEMQAQTKFMADNPDLISQYKKEVQTREDLTNTDPFLRPDYDDLTYKKDPVQFEKDKEASHKIWAKANKLEKTIKDLENKCTSREPLRDCPSCVKKKSSETGM